MPLKSIIYNFMKMRPDEWVHGQRIAKLGLEQGYAGSNAERRARELAQQGVLERRLNEKRCVEYKYKVEAKQINLI